MSKDHNHEDITRAFAAAGAYVVDLSKLGRDKPDLLVGFAGCERLVEVKTEPDPRPKPERMRAGSHCAVCGKSYQAHRRGLVRMRDLRTGERSECERFVIQLVAAPRHGGKLSVGQRAFAIDWPGSPVHVVRTTEDVGRVLGEMVASSLARKRGDARGSRS
jgi:hypothetical protein